MKQQEQAKEENKIVAEYEKKYGYPPDVIETDWDGNVIGCGSHADYDTYAVAVQNGDGYYDEYGHFHYLGGDY